VLALVSPFRLCQEYGQEQRNSSPSRSTSYSSPVGHGRTMIGHIPSAAGHTVRSESGRHRLPGPAGRTWQTWHHFRRRSRCRDFRRCLDVNPSGPACTAPAPASPTCSPARWSALLRTNPRISTARKWPCMRTTPAARRIRPLVAHCQRCGAMAAASRWLLGLAAFLARSAPRPAHVRFRSFFKLSVGTRTDECSLEGDPAEFAPPLVSLSSKTRLAFIGFTATDGVRLRWANTLRPRLLAMTDWRYAARRPVTLGPFNGLTF